VERVDRPQLAVFAAPAPLVAGASVTLGEDVAHHMRVRRTEPGERVRLVDGEGVIAEGTLVRLARAAAIVDVLEATSMPAPAPIHLLVPVADRDRMLWLAEKAAELGLTSWRPVHWRRSRSVSPRGEGPGFQQKVHARMLSALAQSEGAWLPTLYPDATPERAVAATPDGTRLVLDPDGVPLAGLVDASPLTIALGPEGGFDRDERDRLVAAGFVPAAIGGNILRFETAGVAALAVARTMQLAASPTTDTRATAARATAARATPTPSP